MHAAQSFCKLRCLTAAALPRAVLTPARSLQYLPVPKAAFSSSTVDRTSRQKAGVNVNAPARKLTGSFGILAASTLAVATFMGSASGMEAHAEGTQASSAVPVDKLPALSFAVDALEPYIDKMTMEIHHDRHHQTYVTKLQAAVGQAPALKGKSLEDLNKAVGTGDIPYEVKTAVRNNGGGHWNHSFFWKILAPAQSKSADYQGAASDDLKKGIEDGWGSLDAFQAKFNEAATAVFGSGWAWLGVDDTGKLVISTTSNQDNPLMKGLVKDAHIPILGLDVWEHAYYLKYQNKRPDYLKSWWHVVNWAQVTKNYEMAQAGKSPATA